MKTLQVTKQFKKDINRLRKQRKELEKLKPVIDVRIPVNFHINSGK